MACIKTIRSHEADGRLRQLLMKQRELFPAEYDAPAPMASDIDESIVESHTLIPNAQYHAFSTYGVPLSPELPLERRQREMIATVVSAANDCHYWVESHAEFLHRVTLDDGLVAALRHYHTTAPITEAECVMLDYVVPVDERRGAGDTGTSRSADGRRDR